MSKIVNDDLMGLIEKTSDLTPEVGRFTLPYIRATVHRQITRFECIENLKFATFKCSPQSTEIVNYIYAWSIACFLKDIPM